jgi:DNA-binding protein Fis
MRGVDLESLVFEVVQQGLVAAPADETNQHEKIVNRVERELIVQVMQSCNGVQTKAATRLGINRNTLRSKLQQYNLEEQAEE